MTLITLTLLTSAFAANGDPDWTLACQERCVRDGYTIEVLESTTNDNTMVRLWPGNAHETIDAAHYQWPDMFLGHQSAANPLSGGPYCTSYPGAAGHFINGAVYDRVLDHNWDYVETGPLGLPAHEACSGNIDYLLQVLDLYGTGTFDLPSGCSDIGCASGGGVGHDDPGNGVGTYTDAAGDLQELDELLDDDPFGGVTSGGVEFADEEAVELDSSGEPDPEPVTSRR